MGEGRLQVNILLIVLLLLSLSTNGVLVYAFVRLSRRLFEFDDLFEMLAHDVDVNIRYFQKLLTTPLFENSNEVRAANNNMGIISKRLEEFAKRMEELANRDPGTIENEQPGNPPVVR